MEKETQRKTGAMTISKYLLLVGCLVTLSTLSFSCNLLTGPHNGGNGTDTTSNNFTFSTYTFGASNAGSSYLQDVAIINDTDIWAVGTVYLDSADGAPDPFPYNALHWDGKKWNLIKIMFPLCDQYGNHNGSGPFSAKGIFAFSSDNIWITCAVSMVHWDGDNFQQMCMPLGYGERDLGKMWGVNGQLYLVGTNGFIARYTNGSWTKLESGTTEDIQDVWGGTDPTTGKEIALATVSTVFYGGYSRLLRIRGNQADTVSTNGLSWSIRGVWFDSKGYYVVGAELYYKSTLQDTSWQILPQSSRTTGYPEAVRGNSWNDVVVVGDYGTFLHYNGSTWRDFTQELSLHNCNLLAVSMKGNLAVAVGTLGGEKAIAVIAERK
ncbi:MAG: hypothetical protein M1470_02345 [Bacteroidetes bacterium]|nr:hypothetical protein [Bacteroidota bacterium]